MLSRRAHWIEWTTLLFFPLLTFSTGFGCGAHRDRLVVSAVQQGKYGDARETLSRDLEKNKSSRRYMYERMMLSLVDLADGLPESAQQSNDEIYEILRTQGINADKTVASVVLNERVKFWKGEPFEQALMYFYIAVERAWRAEWDNARAAAGSSLFLLRDFGRNERGERKSTQDIATEAVKAENNRQTKDYIGNGYTPIKTNFALGYLMNGIANAALGRAAEAFDNFNEAAQLNAGLETLVAKLKKGDYNTILVIDYGLGPTKIAYGPDRVFSRFSPKPDWPSDDRRLVISVNDSDAIEVPPACDVNRMAADHMWNNMEDVRVAKSVVGSALVAGGGAAVFSSRDTGAQVAGLVIMLIGLAVKASAAADTQHCMILPQRVYVAAVHVAAPDSTITIRVDGDEASEMVLPVSMPPVGERIQLMYVRMTPSRARVEWARNNKPLFAYDGLSERIAGDELPYILGGNCVRKPSHESLSRYHGAGNLRDLTLNDLEELYRLEGLTWSLEENGGRAGKHVLEGGHSLECPRPGSAGFKRLFFQDHPRYMPRNPKVIQIALKQKHAIEQTSASNDLMSKNAHEKEGKQ